ncbi:substrate-binding periplasmic protein [Shewanella sp. JL219SE-S6]
MRCLCCLLLLLFALPTWAKECQQGLTLAYNDWPPYAWTDAFGQPQGLDIEASRLISGKVGCPLSIEAIPAKRAHQMLKSGRIDLLAGATKLPQRQLYAHFSLAYRSEEVRIFVKQGTKPSPRCGNGRTCSRKGSGLFCPVTVGMAPTIRHPSSV